MTDFWNARADALKASVIAKFNKGDAASDVSDGVVYEYLLCSWLGPL